ncbi:MAG: phage tail sheath N-terminal beta-sandwich domain-containing protein, partial [Lachnospirales bacterium]
MALGGGTFITQNKVLPGGYINFVSKSTGVNVFGDRGVGAIAVESNWINNKVKVITKEEFQKNSLSIFGYEYTSDKLIWARDFFKHGKTMIYYCLNKAGSGYTYAKCTYATAKYPGPRGNDLKIVIHKNVDDETKYDVITYLDTTVVDSQTVASASELVDNDFVTLSKSATLQETAGTALTGGTIGDVTGTAVQHWLDEMEGYTFNTITLLYDDYEYQELLAEWTKRMRDEVGKKFQAIFYYDWLHSTNYEGFVVQRNCADWTELSTAWLCGALAGCEINESITDMKYDGEIEIDNTVSN